MLAFAVLSGPLGAAGPAPSRAELTALFAPERVSQVALSPDGKTLVCVLREGRALRLVTRDLDHPAARVPLRVEVEPRGSASGPGGGLGLPYLCFMDATTLVYVVRLPAKTEDAVPSEELHGVDLRTGQDRRLLDQTVFERDYTPPVRRRHVNLDIETDEPGEIGEEGEDTTAVALPETIDVPRAFRVLGPVPGEPGFLVVEALGNALVPVETYRVDLRTGVRTAVAAEEDPARMLYDGTGRPRVRETARVQGVGADNMEDERSPVLARASGKIVPQVFEYRTARGWRPLDALVGAAAGLRFSHADAEYYEPRSLPLALGGDPRVLYYASNVGRDTYALFSLDLETGARTSVYAAAKVDLAGPGDALSERPLVFDRARRLVGVHVPGRPGTTHWFDAGLARLQEEAERAFPGRRVTLREWSDAQDRVLVEVGGPGDPGRVYLLETTPRLRYTELLRRAGNLDARGLAWAFPVALPAATGEPLAGSLTVPRRTRLKLPPLVVRLRDAPGTRAERDEFDRWAQALAAYGFMVLDLDYRGATAGDRLAADGLRRDPDGAPVRDVVAALDALAAQHPYDQRRVALLGEGFGGYVALRALAQFPARFRGAITIDAPTDLRAWLAETGPGSTAELESMRSVFFTTKDEGPDIDKMLNEAPKARRGRRGWNRPVLPEPIAWRRAYFGNASLGQASVLTQAAALRAPVLILQDEDRADFSPAHGRKLRDALERAGQEVEYVRLPPTYAQRDPETLARVARRMGEFLNDHLFDYRVDVGKEREVK
ncbi:alpha/beta fold hydrolase [Opitutus sp. ER46]|uniref:S9 family peptidase n=1 Tax=Opitutus sp. ER46 TaxID=2161864 RepID=UPI000D31A7AB|nr:alpha/beta fold hydrolase [Opitutus sp. ER46]PTX91409.1 hypothetical protein DB354_16060 [Opitutus sp. ER46]